MTEVSHETSSPAAAYQEGGDHYQRLVIQPRFLIRSYDLGFEEGNIVKYVSRWPHKAGLEDLRKSLQYAEFLIEDADLFVNRRRNAFRQPKDITSTEYIQRNDLGHREAHIITLVCSWSELLVKDILPVVRNDILGLIHDATKAERLASA